MNAQQLHLPDGTPSDFWLCGNCKSAWGHKQAKERAESCCLCSGCKCPLSAYGYQCDACEAKNRAEYDRRVFEKAQKLTPAEYKRWVVTRDGTYYESVDALLDAVDPDKVPHYVFACVAQRFAEIDADSIFTGLDEDAYEDFDDSYEGEDEFRAACDAFNAANAHHVCQHEDQTRVVILRPETE